MAVLVAEERVMRSPVRHSEVCPDSRCRTHGRLAKPNFYGHALSIRVRLGRFQPELHPFGVHRDIASRGMPPVIIVDRRGKLPASQATVERKEHGSVQHETVGDWEVRPQQHMDQLAKNHGGDCRVRSGSGKSGKSMEFVFPISRPGKSMEVCQKLWKLQKEVWNF